jgi:hypothetical protein
MAGLVPAIHAPTGIPLIAQSSAFFRTLLEQVFMDSGSRAKPTPRNDDVSAFFRSLLG